MKLLKVVTMSLLSLSLIVGCSTARAAEMQRRKTRRKHGGGPNVGTGEK